MRSRQDDTPRPPALPPTAVDGRAVPSDQRDQLEFAAGLLAGPSGLHRAPRSVLWTGSLGGWSAVVVALTAPSGAALVRVELSAPTEPTSTTGDSRGVSTVLPATLPAKIGLAWQMTAPTDEGDAPPVRNLGVIGPVGATTARLVDGTARLAEVQLTDRAGLLAPPAAGHEKAKVQFTDAAGKVLATVAVLGLHAELPTGLPR